MGNASTLYSLEVQSTTERAGFSRAMASVRRQAGQKEFFSDGLAISRSVVGGKADVVTNAAVKVYFLSVNSPSTATTTAFFQAFNTSSGSVTLGTTDPELSFKVESTKSVTLQLWDGEDSMFTTALSWAVTTTRHGGTASGANEQPTVTLLYK